MYSHLQVCTSTDICIYVCMETVSKIWMLDLGSRVRKHLMITLANIKRKWNLTVEDQINSAEK